MRKGFKKINQDREVTLVCNTKYDSNRRPKVKRVQFFNDYEESPVPSEISPSKVRNLIGLFPKEMEELS